MTFTCDLHLSPFRMSAHFHAFRSHDGDPISVETVPVEVFVCVRTPISSDGSVVGRGDSQEVLGVERDIGGNVARRENRGL